MVVTILGSHEGYIDFKNHLLFPDLELVCTDETEFDKMVFNYANQKNISRLLLKSDKDSYRKCVISNAKQTIIDLADVILMFFDKNDTCIDAYIDYCCQQSKDYIVVSKKHVKTA